jgi:hypothetical protein
MRRANLFVVWIVLLLVGGGALISAQEDDVYGRLPNALGAQSTVSGQSDYTRPGLFYHRWAGRTGYLFTATLLRNPDAADPIEGNTFDGNQLFAYDVRGDIMRRVFSADVADWLSGALFVFAGVSQGGRIDVEVEYPEVPEYDPETDEEPPPEAYQPTVTVQSFVPYVGASVGVGFEVVLISHYSLLFELGYGPILDLSPFRLQSFGVGVTTGLAIRF